MSGSIDWLLLCYRLPREPSTPRIGIWRKLRRLGVAQLGDGLVTLPSDARTQEQLEWIADEILEAGGEASLWRSRSTSAHTERALVEKMANAIEAEYQVVFDSAVIAGATGTVKPQTLGRLRRELRRISKRDYFPPPNREAAHQAVEALLREGVAV